jgi:hypothetical protein
VARTYRRDSAGRFASTGGGGKKKGPGKSSKSAETRKANDGETKRLLGTGMTGAGSRLRSKLEAKFSGGKSAKQSRAQKFTNAEHNQRVGAGKVGPQSMKGGVKGTIGRRRR